MYDDRSVIISVRHSYYMSNPGATWLEKLRKRESVLVVPLIWKT